MKWMEVYDSAFFLTMGGMVFGFLGLAIKFCLKSKCKDFKCLWGMIRILRDVDLEAEIELQEYNISEEKKEKIEENKNNLEQKL